MDKTGYKRFVLLVEGMHKNIRKAKLSEASDLGIKSVHIFWLEHLRSNPDGLTAAELAAKSGVDRSLISREIEALEGAGCVKLLEDGRRYVLTDEGDRLSARIAEKAKEVQTDVNSGISQEELEAFYKTFEKLKDNFDKLLNEKKSRSPRIDI